MPRAVARAIPHVRDLIRPIAHRGLHQSASGVIENTESAVRAAIKKGYGIEVDIQSAKGGAPVVFHDQRLHRLTMGGGHVRDHTIDELKKTPMHETADRIMELGELLELVDGRVPLILEIKSDWRGTGVFEEKVAYIIKDYIGPHGFMSFDPNCVAAIANHVPGIPRGLAAGGLKGRRGVPVPSFIKRMALRHLLSSVIARPDFIAYDIRALPRLAPIIANRLFGLPLFTWTVRTEAQRALAEKWTDAPIFEGLDPGSRPRV